MRPRTDGPKLWLAAVAAAATLIAALYAACGDDSPDGTTTPTEPPSPAMSPISRTATATPLPPLEPTSYRFLYSQSATDADTFWRTDPVDPTARVEVATIPHKPGWALVPALSPDGKKIAYNAMPDLGMSPGTDAETRILDLESGETTLVAQGVDLTTVPRWSPDGGLLFLRRNGVQEVTVILVDLSKPEDGRDEQAEEVEVGEEDKLPPTRTVLRQHVSDVLAYIPLGFKADEATMYFVQIQGGTQSGTFLGRYAPATGEAVATATAIVEVTATAIADFTATAVAEATATAVASTPTPDASATATPTPTASPTPTPMPILTGSVFLALSDQIARDFSLSPDASRVAYLVPSLVGGQFMVQTHVADVKGGRVTPLAAEGLSQGDHLRPTWHPDGDKVSVGQLPSGSNPGRVGVVPLDGDEVTFLPPPNQGFDAPLSWSPDGKFLAVTSFQGESLGNPGPARLVFVSPGGQRLPAPEGGGIAAIGWVKAE